MFALQNTQTRKFEALFFHAPKTAGSHVLEYTKSRYIGEYQFRTLHSILPYYGDIDIPIDRVDMDDHAHLTIDQAFQIYPTLDEWIQENDIDVFTMVRDPYERFVSCLRFIPVMMNLDIDRSGIPKYGGQLSPSDFHKIYTHNIMSPQARWICRDGQPFARTIHLNDVQGKVVEITKGVSVDFGIVHWSNEDASEKMQNNFLIPKFPLDEQTKLFVQWLWKEDFELGL